MTDTTKYQECRDGPLKSETIALLHDMKVKNGWSYHALGSRLGISGAFTHNVLNKNMNISTHPYMIKIASGLDRLLQGDLVEPVAAVETSQAQTRNYTYPLRDDLEVRLTLPKDLTEKESERLSLFIRSLPQ